MDNCNETTLGGYNKKEVNDFVDYVIKKTEENINTIKSQQEELAKKEQKIKQLEDALQTYKRLENTYNYLSQRAEEEAKRIRNAASQEASLIMKEAKDNASRIVNEALLQASKIEQEKDHLNKNIKLYKTKMKNTLREQLELLDDIEVL